MSNIKLYDVSLDTHVESLLDAMIDLSRTRLKYYDNHGLQMGVVTLGTGRQSGQSTAIVKRMIMDTGGTLLYVPNQDMKTHVERMINDLGHDHRLMDIRVARLTVDMRLNIPNDRQVDIIFDEVPRDLAMEILWRLEGTGREATKIKSVVRVGIM